MRKRRSQKASEPRPLETLNVSARNSRSPSETANGVHMLGLNEKAAHQHVSQAGDQRSVAERVAPGKPISTVASEDDISDLY